ncbi:amino acid adenylation domain-containing protein [Nocardia sp. NBC_00508]|uniref:non-ribosomal peptide synthetase n=1 Tax=Nocardia sp. NBC_00508 TaxID=2975992 RepID=UPI002E81C2D6|nr:amino acid adenylation domain-containing protein [Nocardia sp. NBC_00508]WUD68708.1 amino acid adenylation domain-containing protein [Nocardia sp. NBC_00508]
MASQVFDLAELRELVISTLELDGEGLEDDADLISLGVDSIRMMRVAGRLRATGLDVNFAELAAKPSLAAWSELVSARIRITDEREPSDDADDVCFPLAPIQHALWVGRGNQLDLSGVSSHLYVEFDTPRLDVDRLRRAVDKLLARHEMLRVAIGDDGTQRICDLEAIPDRLTVTDLAESDDAQAAGVLADIRRRMSSQSLDIQRGKVIDVAVTQLPGSSSSRLHIDLDMIAADAASYRILVDDLARFYNGVDPVRSIGYSFREYLKTTTGRNQERWEQDRDWWRSRLDELPSAYSLPVVPEAERGPIRTRRYDHLIDGERKAALESAARRNSVTPAAAMAAAFAEAVLDWSAEDDALINVPLFNRQHVDPDVPAIVGDFTSTVLLDVSQSRGATLHDKVTAVQQRLHEVCAHAEYSGIEVLRDLGHRQGTTVIAPVVYTSALGLGELFSPAVRDEFGKPVWLISQGPQVLLDAQVTELDGGLLLNWDVRAEAFPAGMVDAMFDRYRAHIDSLIDVGDWTTAQFTAGLPAAQAAVRATVNRTAQPMGEQLLHESFFVRAATDADKVAIRWSDAAPDQVRTASYGELAASASRVAGRLRELGCKQGDLVAITLPKSVDQVAVALGVLAAGCAYVPISVDQPEARVEAIEAVADIALTITTDERTRMRGARTLSVSDALAGDPLAQPIPVTGRDLAYVLFTSGSTGVPKGVEVEHGPAANAIIDLAERFGLGESDRSVHLASLEFDLSIFDIFGLLRLGGSAVLVDDRYRRDAHHWADLIRAHEATVLNWVPTQVDMLLHAGEPDAVRTVRTVLVGGDWVPAELPSRTAGHIPGVRFASLGGTTENVVHSIVNDLPDSLGSDGPLAYGIPMRNIHCRVVGSTGADCPDWVPGELWIGGVGVARGYRGDPERTRSRFVSHEGTRWFRTGDLAYYSPDGVLRFIGRRDNQVKVNGHRIELGEVETALRSLPMVHHAAAGTAGSPVRLCAAVTLEPGATASSGAEDIRDALGGLLPEHMIPSSIEVSGSLPLTNNGKMDRAALRREFEKLAATAPIVETDPEDSFEAAVCTLVAELVGRRTVGPLDDFFAAGGTSVLATLFVRELRDRLPLVDVQAADVFSGRNIRAIVRRVRDRNPEPGRLVQAGDAYLEIMALTDEQVFELNAD